MNQTRLIRDLLEECGMTEDEICNALGITKHYLAPQYADAGPNRAI